MADSGIKTIIGLAVVGVGGWWVYNNFIAPMLAAQAAAGKTTAAGGGPGGTTGTTTTTPPPASAWASSPVYPLGSGPCSPANVLAPILAAAQKGNPNLSLGPSGTDGLNIDQWGYYMNQTCSGLQAQSGLTADAIFPNDPNRGGVLNFNAFAGYAKGQGMSGYRRGLGTNLVRRAA